MSRIDDYRQYLQSHGDWEAFILANSGLPGPRGNLELVWAVAETGDEERFARYARWDAPTGRADDPSVVLIMAGAVGLGRLTAEGSDRYWETLRLMASDARWRVREGVAMALQRVGMVRYDALIEQTCRWRRGSPLEQRALVAGVCEPALLTRPARARHALELLTEVTAALAVRPDRRAPDVRVLRQALGYCWSVAIVALPEEGWEALKPWAASTDADVRWIVKENLAKKRLVRLDPDRVTELQSSFLTGTRAAS